MRREQLDKFLSKIVRVMIVDRPDWELGPCWVWQGSVTAKGYGRFCVGSGKTVLSHRLAFQHWVGDLLEGFVVDHLCNNKGCCNPIHLKQISNMENLALASERRPWGRRNQFSH